MAKKKNKQKQLQGTPVAIAQSYSGPLPPASQFQKYEEVFPGAAKKIIDNFDKTGNSS